MPAATSMKHPRACRARFPLLLLLATIALPGAPRQLTAAPVAGALLQAKQSTPPSRRAATRSTTRRTSAAAAPLKATAPVGASALTADLGSMLAARTRNGSWGALVVSLSRGDTLFSASPDVPMVPASTMKTFTSALALERLGPEHTFSTDVLRDGPLTGGGVVEGNLILRGDGDPSLSGRFHRGGPGAAVDQLAQFVAGAGVKRVTGDLVADASALEGRRIPEGWLSRWMGLSYAAPFSALSLNENMVIVGVYPEGTSGAATVRLEPASSELRVVSSARIVPGRSRRLRVTMVGETDVVVTGTIGASASPHRVQLVVADPVTYTAGAFREALRAQGIEVEGAVRVGRTPEHAERVTSLPSPSLSKLVALMNRESNNHYAEQIFRSAARGPSRNEPGTAEHGFATLQDFAQSALGIEPGDLTATDGSGLSVLDRITPRALVHLMDYAHRAPWSSVFHASLPVAGESETLQGRMRGSAAQGNLHAKTGTTNEVIALSGYVTAENGELLAFAFLYNGVDRWNARETIDAMGPTLAAFRR